MSQQAYAALGDSLTAGGGDLDADPAFWSEDRVHPNARGHRFIAEAFADLLLSTSTLAGARRT